MAEFRIVIKAYRKTLMNIQDVESMTSKETAYGHHVKPYVVLALNHFLSVT